MVTWAQLAKRSADWSRPLDVLSMQARQTLTCACDDDGANLILDGWRIEEKPGCVGAGAYGAVFVVRDVDGRLRALKMLNADLADAEAVHAHILETHAGCLCDSEHVARYERLVSFHPPAGAAPVVYLVREFVDGQSGDEHTFPDGGQLISIFIQLAQGLHDLHDVSLGRFNVDLVHRDVHLRNVVIGSDENGQPSAKWIDLGRIRMLGQTGTGAQVHYKQRPLGFPPETWDGQQFRIDFEKWGQLGDVYALGAMLFEVATGHKFRDFKATPLRLLKATCAKQIPDDVEPLLKTALAPRAEDRMPMGVLTERLKELL